MNNDNYKAQAPEIDIRELFWDLLIQWRPIILTSILVALIVCATKYTKDMQNYHAQIESQKTAANQRELSLEEITAKALEGLSNDEKSEVNY